MKKSILFFMLAAAALFPIQGAADECMEGDCDNGHGVGFTDEGGVYNGEWRNGVPDGQGTLSHGKSTYVGGFKDGRFHGYGVYTKSDGTVQEGNWEDGIFKGR